MSSRTPTISRLVHENTPISCCMTTIQIIIMQLIIYIKKNIFFSFIFKLYDFSSYFSYYFFLSNRIKCLVQRHEEKYYAILYLTNLCRCFSSGCLLCLHLLDICCRKICLIHIYFLFLIVGARICWTTQK